MGIRRRRHDFDDRRLRALRAHDRQWRHARRQALSQPENRRLYGVEPYRTRGGRRARSVLFAGSRLRFRIRFRGADRGRRQPDRRIGRRNELVRRRGHHLLDRSEGRHVRGLHVPDRLATRPHPRRAEEFGLRRVREVDTAVPTYSASYAGLTRVSISLRKSLSRRWIAGSSLPMTERPHPKLCSAGNVSSSQILTADTLPVRKPIPVSTISTPIARSMLARCRFIRANSDENCSTMNAAIRNGMPRPAEYTASSPAPLVTVASLAATDRMAARIGPMHGVQPNANASPIT